MTTPSRRVGRRMQHTRQLLQHTFIEVAHEKGIAATTVKVITQVVLEDFAREYRHLL